MAENRYVSEAITLPEREESGRFPRADLVFHRVDHSQASYEARLFLNNPAADEGTPLDEESGYAGSFYIFAHEGCFGDIGHCDLPDEPSDPFDRRPLHPLTPHKKAVEITEPLERLAEAEEEVTVTVVPITVDPVSTQARTDDVLRFERLVLVTYS